MEAAQGFQESRLKQSTRSHMGAVGVMQLLPSTAADPKIGITGIDKSAERNIKAGTKYLRHLIDVYPDDPKNDEEQDADDVRRLQRRPRQPGSFPQMGGDVRPRPNR